MTKVYRIYIDPERDKDLYEYLQEKVPRPLRGEFVTTGLRYYIEKALADIGLANREKGTKDKEVNDEDKETVRGMFG